MNYLLVLTILLFTSLGNANDINEFYASKDYKPRDLTEYELAAEQVSDFMEWDKDILLGWGYEETRHKDLICFNIPGVKYKTGRVKRFSIDYGWVGINSRNFKFAMLKAQQLQFEGQIPRDLRLYKFPSMKKYFRMYRQGKKLKEVEFACDLDCKKSMLIYRIIIEEDRGKYKWQRECQEFLQSHPLHNIFRTG